MKIRNGFVSNSSSSSFVIGSNDHLEIVLNKEWENIYPATGSTKDLITSLKREAVYHIMSWEIEPNEFETWEEFQNHVKHNWKITLDGKENFFYKQFFINWKYVTLISIPGGGDGGPWILHHIRDSFPKNFKNNNIEIKLDEGA